MLLRGEYRSACRCARDEDWLRQRETFDLASGILEEAGDRQALAKDDVLSNQEPSCLGTQAASEKLPHLNPSSSKMAGRDAGVTPSSSDMAGRDAGATPSLTGHGDGLLWTILYSLNLSVFLP